MTIVGEYAAPGDVAQQWVLAAIAIAPRRYSKVEREAELTLRDMEGRIAAVTGGARGIGQSVVEQLAARGARVVILDLNEELGQELARKVDGHFYRLDIGDDQAVSATVAQIEKEVGFVEHFAANAAIIQRKFLPPEELTLDEWDAMFRIDLRGTYHSCVEFGKRMARKGRGSIVAVASIAGARSAPNHIYSAAKAGVIEVAANLAVEWGRSGVRVNSVSPGFTKTPAVLDAISAGFRSEQKFSEYTALGRMMEPSELAAAMVFLLSDQASAITGVNLPVDAGWSAATNWVAWNGVPPARERA